MRDPLDQLNDYASCDFRLDSFDGSRLRLIGGLTLAYPDSHTVEALLADVTYMNCATAFHDARFRHATGSEVRDIQSVVPIENSEIVIVIEAATMAKLGRQRFVIVAESVSVSL